MLDKNKVLSHFSIQSMHIKQANELTNMQTRVIIIYALQLIARLSEGGLVIK